MPKGRLTIAAPFEAEICRVEFRKRLQTLPVLDRHGVALPFDHAVAPKLLQRPVHVDGRDAEHIAHLPLGQRQREGQAVEPG